MAVGENAIVMENKEYFDSYGINIGILESVHSKTKANKRSTTMLLIKNLKFESTDPAELEDIFAKYVLFLCYQCRIYGVFDIYIYTAVI